jgi:hypothetical protein
MITALAIGAVVAVVAMAAYGAVCEWLARRPH